MSYKLNNNLLFAALVACFVLSSVKVQAQATVTLVVDEHDNLTDNELPTKNGLEKGENSSADALKEDALITPPVETPKEAPMAEVDEEFSLDLNVSEVPTPANNEAAELPSAPIALNAPVATSPAPAPATVAPVSAPATVVPTAATAPSPAAASTTVAPAGATAAAATTAATPAATVEPLPKSTPEFGNTLLSKIDNDLFNQMSDIEKQTTLLTLELRREKLRNELEAIKEQRVKAYEEKLAAEEEKKRKQQEWEKEQEAKVLREQQALKEKEIALEKLKQRKALNEYMNQMLAQNQKWIAENNKLYKKMRDVENDRRRVTEDFKGKLEKLKVLAEKYLQTSTDVKSSYDRTVANFSTQINQLKKRLEAEELAAKNREENPFATNGENGQSGDTKLSGIDLQIAPFSLSKEYAILDISGQGDDLSAKLINKDGQSFGVRVGTALQTGHVVEKITKNSIQFDKDGLKDYLYTSVTATGVEPEAFVETPDEMLAAGKTSAKTTAKKPAAKPAINKKQGLLSTSGMLSLGKGMFVK